MRPKDVKRAMEDPLSLGNILLEGGFISESDIVRAIGFQQDHSDLMFGEALIRMEIIERATLEAMLVKQEAMRQRSSKAVGKLVQIATRATKENALAMQGIRAQVHAVTGIK